MGLLLTGQTQARGGGFMMIIWIVVLFVFLYFFMIRPQKKETKRKNEMMNSLEVGDTVMTSSGFFGTVIDINDDTVIVEFGSNRNCRIPMQRSAIAAIEKPVDSTKAIEEKKDPKKDAKSQEPKKDEEKKGLFKRPKEKE